MRTNVESVRRIKVRQFGLLTVVTAALFTCGTSASWAQDDWRAEPLASREAPLAHDAQTPTLPLDQLLRADGSLDLQSGYQGSVSVDGWRMAPMPDGSPRFERSNVDHSATPLESAVDLGATSVPDDVQWDARFPVPGVYGGTVSAMAMDGMGNLYVGGGFAIAGSASASRVAKWNGTTWSALGSGMNDYVEALAVDGNGNLYAGGYFTIAGGVSASRIAKWDGTTWSGLGTGMNNLVMALAVDVNGNLYAGGSFTTAGGVSASRVAKWNGTNWSAVGSGQIATVYAVAVDGIGNLYAGGGFTSSGGAKYIAKWNGATWSQLGLGMNGEVYALAVDASGILYAGGYFTTAGGVSAAHIAKWNGTTWSKLGSGLDSYVSAITVDGSGKLYVGGGFAKAGGISASCIAKWSGTAWSALGAGIDGDVYAVAVGGSGQLYAGGSFSTAGGVQADNLAKWNGAVWAPAGPGLNDGVDALALDGSGNLYVGGYFTTAGGISASRIAKWNGTTWSALGSGMNDYVRALAVDGSGNLYAGGAFTTAGGISASHIAKWNGTTWSALSSGMNDEVYGLLVDGSGTLYAGGIFSTAGGIPATYAAKWNGTTWSSLGTGGISGIYVFTVDGSGNLYAGGGSWPGIAKRNGTTWSALGSGITGAVSAIAIDRSGNIYAGGTFTIAGGVSASNIAKWNGTTWSALGTGMNGWVGALAVDGSGRLYAAGNFTTAGGVSAPRIAMWNGNTWSALGSGLESAGDALAVDGTGNLYAGGWFTTAGTKPSGRVAIWHGITTPPVSPTGLLASTAGPHEVHLEWLDASDNEYRFEIERKTGLSGAWSTVSMVPAQSITWNDLGLTTGQAYYYRVRAWNPAGYSPYQVQSCGVPSDLPAAPSSLAVASVSATSATLTWQRNATNEHGYIVQRRLASATLEADWKDLEFRPGAGSTAITDGSLIPGLAYVYRVASYILNNGAVRSAWSNFVDAVALANAGPFDRDIRVTHNGTPVMGYRLLVDRNDGNGLVAEEVTINGQGIARLTSLRYGYRIRAEKFLDQGTSDDSVKGGHEAFAGNRRWEIWLHSDQESFTNRYNYEPFRFDTGTDQSIIELKLNYPVYRFNLVVSMERDLEESAVEWGQLQSGFQGASEVLYEASDGLVALGRVAVYHDKDHWEDADVQIHNKTARSGSQYLPKAWTGGINRKGWDGRWSVLGFRIGPKIYKAIHLPETYYNPNKINALTHSWMIAHEFSHYGLSLLDEYRSSTLPQDKFTALRELHPDDYPAPSIHQYYGLMDLVDAEGLNDARNLRAQYSSNNDYLRSYVSWSEDKKKDELTAQYYVRKQSCWAALVDSLDAITSENVTLLEPMPGWRPQTPYASHDRLTYADDPRLIDGQDMLDPHKLYAPIEFLAMKNAAPGSPSRNVKLHLAENETGGRGAVAYRLNGERGFAELGPVLENCPLGPVSLEYGDRIVVYELDARHGRVGRVELPQETSSAGVGDLTGDLGMRMDASKATEAIDVGFSYRLGFLGADGDSALTLELLPDAPLRNPPMVLCSYGVRTDSIAMAIDLPSGYYRGATPIWFTDPAGEGGGLLEISMPDSAGGESLAAVNFTVLVPSIEPERGLTGCGVTVAAAAAESTELPLVTISDAIGMAYGSETVPGMQVAGPLALHVFGASPPEGGVEVEVSYDDTAVRGLDEKTIHAYRFDDGALTWSPVDGIVVSPVRNVVSFRVVGDGTFALFIADATADTIPPAAVSDLSAATGDESGSVVLDWMATGDDAGVGQAAGYEMGYSPTPFNASQWDSVPKLPRMSNALSSGGHEVKSVFLPVDGRGYYFAARALDEGGNLSALSNTAFAVSGVGDLNDKPGIATFVRAIDNEADDGGKIMVLWNKSSDDGAGKGSILRYRIYRQEEGSYPALIDSVAAGTVAFVDSTVVNNSAYSYWVAAADSTHESLSQAEHGLAARNVGAPAGDVTSDMVVGLDDMCSILRGWAADSTSVAYDPLHDLSGNRIVDVQDLMILATTMGTGGTPAILTPGQNAAAVVTCSAAPTDSVGFVMTIMIEGAQNLAGYSLMIDYPAGSVQFLDAVPRSAETDNVLTKDGGLTPYFLVGPREPGRVLLANCMVNASETLAPDGDGLLARVFFSGGGGAENVTLSDVILIDSDGKMNAVQSTVVRVPDAEVPRAFLHQSYPNPFNAHTVIRYEIPRKAEVSVKIYNLRGQLVRTLVNEVRDVGMHSVSWNGMDDDSRGVASGVYFYRLITEGYEKTRKLTLLK